MDKRIYLFGGVIDLVLSIICVWGALLCYVITGDVLGTLAWLIYPSVRFLFLCNFNPIKFALCLPVKIILSLIALLCVKNIKDVFFCDTKDFGPSIPKVGISGFVLYLVFKFIKRK